MFVYFVFIRVALVSCSCQAQALSTFFPKHSNMSRSDSNTNGSKKRGTATEHAKQQKRGTATEHGTGNTWNRQYWNRGLKPNAQTQQYMEQAQADRADNTFEHLLFLLADFLTHVLRELCPRVAAQCEDVVFDKIADWAATSSDKPSFYNESELLLHKKMWDVINRDVRGVPKEHFFVQWCRRISIHRTNVRSAVMGHLKWSNSFHKKCRLHHDIIDDAWTILQSAIRCVPYTQ
jgi:hypothetical protein